MSRYVEVHRICDPSPLHEDKVPATTEKVLSVGKGKPVLLDLCDECAVVFDGLLANAVPVDKANSTMPKPPRVKAEGEVAEPPRRKGRRPVPGPHLCPLCNRPPLGSRKLLGDHISKVHKIKISDVLARGQTVST